MKIQKDNVDACQLQQVTTGTTGLLGSTSASSAIVQVRADFVFTYANTKQNICSLIFSPVISDLIGIFVKQHRSTNIHLNKVMSCIVWNWQDFTSHCVAMVLLHTAQAVQTEQLYSTGGLR